MKSDCFSSTPCCTQSGLLTAALCAASDTSAGDGLEAIVALLLASPLFLRALHKGKKPAWLCVGARGAARRAMRWSTVKAQLGLAVYALLIFSELWSEMRLALDLWRRGWAGWALLCGGECNGHHAVAMRMRDMCG